MGTEVTPPSSTISSSTSCSPPRWGSWLPVEGRNVEDLIAMVDGRSAAIACSTQCCAPVRRRCLRRESRRPQPAKLRDNPHGIDLGAPNRLPAVPDSGEADRSLRRPFLELTRLEARAVEWAGDGRLRLIGRRHLRSNNSGCTTSRCWSRARPAAPADQPRRRCRTWRGRRRQGIGLSRVGEVTADVEVPIPACWASPLPHGWGHGQPGARLDVAARHAGVIPNVLTDPLAIDLVSGTSVLNGILVEAAPA